MNNSALIKELASSIETGIEAEVTQRRMASHDRIGSREVARDFINNNLASMPLLVKGEHIVTFDDERGNLSAKSQPKNLSIWTVALQTTIETGQTSPALLGAILQQWAKETLNKEWTIDAAQRVATKFIESMQAQTILNVGHTVVQYLDDEQKQQTSKVFKLTATFNESAVTIVDGLREASHMQCRPLENMPVDWVSQHSGVGVNAGLKLIKGTPAIDIVSTKVLSAVNKLQHVQFTVSPAMVDAAYDIMDNQHEYNSTREELAMFAEIVQYDNKCFYFPVTMDSRGRMYYRGGLLSPQGTDFCKAAFQFANPAPLGDDGLHAIFVHTANMLGFDKLPLTQRIRTIQQFIDDGSFGSITDHADVAAKWPNADVFQATVAILEIIHILASGATDSALVCHQDGTCNGLQHMSAITKNRETAITVNCVESSWDDVPADIYGIVADAALEANGLSEDAQALILKYGRSMAKNPVMITGYGAGEETVKANTAKYLAEKGENPAFGEEIGAAYVSALDANAGAVRALTGAVKARVARALELGVQKYQWTTADGFVATTEYRDIECNRVRAGVFNALVRNMHPAPLDIVKTTGAMAPNFIHSIDATHLRMVVNDCDHDLVTVHDSIGSHAGTYFATAKSIREQFVQVHQYDALDNLCANMSIGDKRIRTPNFRGDYNATEALKSSYIFS